jgi:Phytanoyl-CoA dioxygenase (PhyH)
LTKAVIPLLSPQQADSLYALYKTTYDKYTGASNLHHTTTDTQNPNLIYHTDAEIKKMFIPALDKHLINYKPLAATFHVKESGEGSATGLHQDPTFVDETQYQSANVWVALQDTNETNGNLYFLEGSHKLVPSLRITPFSPNYYNTYTSEMLAAVKQVPLKKGEAVIFYNATIHGATDNQSNDIRLAATLLISSLPAQWLIYYRDIADTKGPIEKYNLTLDEFVHMPKNGRPSALAFAEKINYQFPSLSVEAYREKMAALNPQKDAIARLFNLINSF